MRPKLNDRPEDWRNFVLLWCAVLLFLSGIAYLRKLISMESAAVLLAIVAIIAVITAFRPRLFGPAYRLTMRISFRVGQTVGKVLLTFVYLFILTPLGLLLRLAGKDLLNLKRSSQKTSHWKPAQSPGRLEDQF